MNKVLLNPNTEIHVNGYPIMRDLCPKCTQRLIKALYRPEESKRRKLTNDVQREADAGTS